jgi:hypothetical protein
VELVRAVGTRAPFGDELLARVQGEVRAFHRLTAAADDAADPNLPECGHEG